VFEPFLHLEGWISLLTLAAMEIVLGIDNIVFLTLMVAKVSPERRRFTRTVGLVLALAMRLILLLSISWVMSLKEPLFTIFSKTFSGRDIILFVGGAFLVGKATHEMYDKLEVDDDAHLTAEEKKQKADAAKRAPLIFVLIQIALLDIIFSLDSVITAVGMAQHISIMMVAMVIAVAVMLIFAGKVGEFVTRHPSMTILALSFLILIGVMLVADALGQHVSKGYIYAAMAFSLFVEILNMRLRKKRKQAPVQLHQRNSLPEIVAKVAGADPPARGEQSGAG
jgi:predicted tellurium resistance membrane protein TerC